MNRSGEKGPGMVSPRRVTQGNGICHHFYFTNSTWSKDGSALYYVGYVDDLPNIFRVDLDALQPERLTDRRDLNPFSPAADLQDRYIYFTGGRSVRSLALADGSVEEIARFDDGFPSNCSVSRDGRWVATSVRGKGRHRLIAVDTEGGEVKTVLEGDRPIGHVQFSPLPPYQILYSGPPDKRIWLVDLDGGNDRLLYPQMPDDWIVHESWFGPDEVIFTHWPYALKAIHVKTGQVRTLAAMNAWHACADAEGKRVVFDTVHPDTGLYIYDAGQGAARPLCLSRSSNLGSQWRLTVPAPGSPADPSIFRDVLPDGPVEPPDRSESAYGPQWTHPHPAFSPDGRKVAFTSDMAGSPDVYVVDVDV